MAHTGCDPAAPPVPSGAVAEDTHQQRLFSVCCPVPIQIFWIFCPSDCAGL